MKKKYILVIVGILIIIVASLFIYKHIDRPYWEKHYDRTTATVDFYNYPEEHEVYYFFHEWGYPAIGIGVTVIDPSFPDPIRIEIDDYNGDGNIDKVYIRPENNKLHWRYIAVLDRGLEENLPPLTRVDCYIMFHPAGEGDFPSIEIMSSREEAVRILQGAKQFMEDLKNLR